MGKRYRETTRRESPAWPLDLGLGPKSWHTEVVDRKTGERGSGWGSSPKESRERAWKNLREKQGA